MVYWSSMVTTPKIKLPISAEDTIFRRALYSRDRRMRSRRCVLCAVSLAVSFCWARTYYIDPVNGNDSYAGSSEVRAWKTIAKANQTLSPGDTVLIKAGAYNDASINPARSGTSESASFDTTRKARITAVNYADNKLIVDKALTWTQNRGVCLAYEGSAPDIGAFEYGAANSITPASRIPLRTEPPRIIGLYDLTGRKIYGTRAGGHDGRPCRGKARGRQAGRSCGGEKDYKNELMRLVYRQHLAAETDGFSLMNRQCLALPCFPCC